MATRILLYFFCHTFSSQSGVPVRGMTRSQTPRRPVAHCESPSHGWGKSTAHGEARRGSRGAEKVSVRTSLRSSAAPSTLAAFPKMGGRGGWLPQRGLPQTRARQTSGRRKRPWHPTARHAGPNGHGSERASTKQGLMRRLGFSCWTAPAFVGPAGRVAAVAVLRLAQGQLPAWHAFPWDFAGGHDDAAQGCLSSAPRLQRTGPFGPTACLRRQPPRPGPGGSQLWWPSPHACCRSSRNPPSDFDQASHVFYPKRAPMVPASSLH